MAGAGIGRGVSRSIRAIAVRREPGAPLRRRRWIAYVSDESGALEVWVRPFPSGPGRWRVSTGGGRGPRWRSDGEEIFYVTPDGKLMAVPVRTHGGFEVDLPKPLFDVRIQDTNNRVDYEVTRDWQRFLLNELVSGTAVLNVISNWRSPIEQ
jgi:hypothetical protein